MWLHYFFPLVLTKLIFTIFFTFLDILLLKAYFLTNLVESDIREVLWQFDTCKVKNYILNKMLLP
jgi:hypothetical protein